jgi:predicted O-methyltransferase YrrM
MTRLADIASFVPPVARLRAERDRLNGEVVDLRGQLAAAQAESGDRERELENVTQEARELRGAIVALTAAEPAYRLFPEGHFYSPIPDLPDVRARAAEIFDRSGDVRGMEIDVGRQLDLLSDLEPALRRWPHGEPRARTGLRYRPDNGFFGWTDAQVWYALLATRRPRKVVEVGSGWSTALLLDTCDEEDLPTRVTAIEPYPDRLRSVMRDGDDQRVTLIESRVQEVPAEDLADLEPGDVLFVDSTHVAKVGSDVVRLVFEVFPRLPPGVLVHVHDIAYPFEYPIEWIEEGRAWNEAYLLRAFLMNNPSWRVVLWPSLLWLRAPERIRAALHPDSLVDGGSLWLETTPLRSGEGATAH